MTMRGLLVAMLLGVLLWLALIGIVYVARAATSDTKTTLRYRTAAGRVLIVRGVDCFSQEDVTQLRLVDYDSPDKVVYRCVTP